MKRGLRQHILQLETITENIERNKAEKYRNGPPACELWVCSSGEAGPEIDLSGGYAV